MRGWMDGCVGGWVVWREKTTGFIILKPIVGQNDVMTTTTKMMMMMMMMMILMMMMMVMMMMMMMLMMMMMMMMMMIVFFNFSIKYNFTQKIENMEI